MHGKRWASIRETMKPSPSCSSVCRTSRGAVGFKNDQKYDPFLSGGTIVPIVCSMSIFQCPSVGGMWCCLPSKKCIELVGLVDAFDLISVRLAEGQKPIPAKWRGDRLRVVLWITCGW